MYTCYSYLLILVFSTYQHDLTSLKDLLLFGTASPFFIQIRVSLCFFFTSFGLINHKPFCFDHIQIEYD